ncbi:MAG: hypothetical protein ACLP9L_40295 [Thermoguttaceae bacterium]
MRGKTASTGIVQFDLWSAASHGSAEERLCPYYACHGGPMYRLSRKRS